MESEERVKREVSEVRADKEKRILLIFTLLLFIVSCILLTIGSADITMGEIYAVIMHHLLPQTFPPQRELAELVVWNIRLPRILLGIATGIGLGIAGTIIQGVTKNPLASPYTLGIASGAAFGAGISLLIPDMAIGREYLVIVVASLIALLTTLFILYLSSGEKETATRIALEVILGASFVWLVLTRGYAFVFDPASLVTFSLIALFILLGVRRWKGMAAPKILLACVGIGMVWMFTRFLPAIIFFDRPGVIGVVLTWTVSIIEQASWADLRLFVPLLLLYSFLLVAYLYIRKLKDFKAVSTDKGQERVVLMVLASFLIASTVRFAGTIPFPGLIAPHLAYVTVGRDNRFLIPASGLIGALLIAGTDIVARSVMAPDVIPVGVIMGFVGIPLFIFLLVRMTRGSS